MNWSLLRCLRTFLIIFIFIFLAFILYFQHHNVKIKTYMTAKKIATIKVSRDFKPPFILKRHSYDPKSNDSLPMNELLDLNNFTFYHNYPKLCIQDGSPYLFVFIHSDPTHFRRREVIRQTWGSPSAQAELKFRIAFLLGDPKNENIQKNIDQESEQYHDIIQGNFIDTYRNLSYKHLMGYKWVLNFCRNTTFVLKSDDDAFIDIFALILYAQKNFVNSTTPPKDILGCCVFPAGYFAVKRKGTHKLTYEEYPYNSFPTYCSGLAYLVTPDIISDLYYASFKIKPFVWIDDLFVTGVLPSVYPIRHFFMNLEYSYTLIELKQWLKNKILKPSPFMIGDLDSNFDVENVLPVLWNKTVRAWKWKIVNESQIQSINQKQILQF